MEASDVKEDEEKGPAWRGAGPRGEKVTQLTAPGNVLLTSLFQAQADSRGKMSSQNPPGGAALVCLRPLKHSRRGFHTEAAARNALTRAPAQRKLVEWDGLG